MCIFKICFSGGGAHMTFGEKLRIEREKVSISQEKLAAQIGLTRNAIVNYERGASYPRSRDIYFKLADFFKVNVNYFLTDDEAFITQATERYGRKGSLEAHAILQEAAAVFAGGELSEEDMLGFIHDMQAIYLKATDRAREKYTPKKHRKSKSSEE